MTVSLPARGTEEGAVARLVLIEARGPSYATYSATDSLTSMQWMKVVLANRLNNNPRQFMAPHAATLIDIIKAPGQFAGFQKYPHYDSALADMLQSIIDIANSTKDARSADFAGFVQNGLKVAREAPVADPSSTGIFAWRTQGSSPPGGRYAKFKDLAGNTFYTLSA